MAQFISRSCCYLIHQRAQLYVYTWTRLREFEFQNFWVLCHSIHTAAAAAQLKCSALLISVQQHHQCYQLIRSSLFIGFNYNWIFVSFPIHPHKNPRKAFSLTPWDWDAANECSTSFAAHSRVSSSSPQSHHSPEPKTRRRRFSVAFSMFKWSRRM